jgi:hypothetical protein
MDSEVRSFIRAARGFSLKPDTAAGPKIQQRALS